MGDLQASIEFLVELSKFYNVDLFIRGYYQFRFTFKPPKSSHAIRVEVCEGHGGRGAFTLYPAFVTADGQTAVSRTFNIYYKDEEVLLKDVFLFRVNLLIDSTKAADCIEKTALEMNVDVHFTDQVLRDTNYQTLPLVTSRTLKFHLSCFNGLHHQLPLLFDYYYFSVLDLIIHASVVSLGLPNWNVLKQVKTGWFSKSAPRSSSPRSSSPLFFGTLFGNRYQLGSQFYTSDVAFRYAVPSYSITRENFERASAIHRNLCAILAMAHFQLLNYFEEMMQYLDEKQRIKLGDKLDPADLVEGLCKKVETLQSCEEVFDEICSDLSVLNNELALLWSQFQESFVLNDNIRPLLREQHHHERMMHFSEAFFVHALPWKALLNATDSSAQKHTSMGQCVKSSRYLSLIPPVTIECAEVDGDPSTTPIFFEDRYVSMEEACANQVTVKFSGGACMSEDEVLEHKPLSLGIFNEAFHDGYPVTDDSLPKMDDTCSNDDEQIDIGEDVWVDISKEEIVYAAQASNQENPEKGNGNEGERTDKLEGGSTGDDVLDNAVCLSEGQSREDTGGAVQNEQPECPRNARKDFTEIVDEAAENRMRSEQGVTLDDEAQQVLREGCCVDHDELTDILARQQSGSNLELREPLGTDDCRETDDISASGKSGTDSVSLADVQTSFVEAVKSDVENTDHHGDEMAAFDLTEPREDTLMVNDSFHSVVENHIGVEELRTCLSQEALKEADTQEHCMAFSGSSVKYLVKDSESGEQDNKSNGSWEASQQSDVMIEGLAEDEADCRVENTCDVASNSSEEILIENVTGSGVDSCGTGSDVDKYLTGSDVDKCVTGSDVDKCVTGSDIDKCGTGNDIDKCVTGSVVDRYSTGSEVDPKCFPGDDVDKCCAGSEVKMNKEEMLTDRTNGSDAVETRLHPFCHDVKQSSESEARTTVESKLPLNSKIEDSCDEGCQTRSFAHRTLERKVSNSVFYERTSKQECGKYSKMVNDEEERRLTEQFAASASVAASVTASASVAAADNTTVLRLSSNSAADVSCFCVGKTSPKSESEKTNLTLQKAKDEVKSRMNYCGKLYSDFPAQFLVRPYFIDPKPDLSLEPVHFVICVHGLDGNSGDLRLLRCFLEMALPSTKFEFLMSEINQDNTFLPFDELTEKLVSEIIHHMEAFRIKPSRISFIGHSLGNIIIRSALTHPLLKPYVALFHTFLSLSGPHLGMIYHTSSLVSTGLWLMQKWKKSASLLQLSLNDSQDLRESFLYKLSKKKGLEYFTNVLLVSSVQDHYVPFHSSRIELPKTLSRSNSQECSVYREMMENILTPLLSKPNRRLVRYSVYHCLPSSTNTFIGRAAHIAMLDSELFIEKLICRSAAKYFQ